MAKPFVLFSDAEVDSAQQHVYGDFGLASSPAFKGVNHEGTRIRRTSPR